MSVPPPESLLAAAKSRGAIKDLGARIDADPALRAAFVGLAERRGFDLSDEAELSGKRLVRLLLDRSSAAQVRKNPIHRDEAFRCAHCGRDVPPGGAPVRDHCPWCLRGLHVDVVPGDRAADCGGVLDPYAIERRPPDVLLRLRCRACAHTFTVRAHPEDRVPPSLDVRDLPT